MGLFDGLKSAATDALHAGADSAYEKALGSAGVGTSAGGVPTSTPAGSTGTAVAGASPVSTDGLHFTPSGLIAYAQANPVKAIVATLVLGGLALWGYRKFVRR